MSKRRKPGDNSSSESASCIAAALISATSAVQSAELSTRLNNTKAPRLQASIRSMALPESMASRRVEAKGADDSVDDNIEK